MFQSNKWTAKKSDTQFNQINRSNNIKDNYYYED